MTIHIELSEDAFAAMFQPQANHLDANATCDWGNGYGTLYETFGEELEYVKQQPAAYIWTWIHGDDGEFIVSGFHFVNRIGYFICPRPVPDGVHIEVELETPDVQDGPLSELPPPLPAGVVAAMDRVVAYLWRDEQRHLQECHAEGAQSASHIFHSLRIVRDWLGSFCCG